MSKKNKNKKIEKIETPEIVENNKEEKTEELSMNEKESVDLKENKTSEVNAKESNKVNNKKIDDEKSENKIDNQTDGKANNEADNNTSNKTDESKINNINEAEKENNKELENDKTEELKNKNENLESNSNEDEEENNIEDSESYKEASFKEKLSLKFRKRLISSGIHTIILVVFLVLIFFGVNIWAGSRELAQIDVTENHLYSVTQASKDQLANLNKDVYIYIYGYNDNNDYVTFIKQYSAFNNHIHYEIVTEETNYEIVSKYNLSDYGNAAMVIVCGDKDKTVYPEYEFSSYDYSTGESVNIAEETITNAILNVSTDDPIKVYFATGDGEYKMSEVSTLVAYLQAQVYECEELNLLAVTEVPDDCDILAILDPTQDITEMAATAIKNYINKGGNIIFGQFRIDKETKIPNLQSILDLYGVSLSYGVLYEGRSSNSFAYENYSYPYILIPNLSSSNEISSELSKSGLYVIIPWAQSLSISNVEEDNVIVSSSNILTTSDKCYNITDLNGQLKTDGLEAKEYIIGSELTRTVTTPADDTNAETTSVSSKLLVFGNAGFMADYFTIGQMQLSPIQYPGNANFALNAFAELAEQEDLITVRKSSNVTNFESTTQEDRIVKTIIFGIPVIIILAGIIIWNIRRRKR
ncbi:MAG: hypothetical protein HFJ45_00625 [Clostridia bacterium]|nr:hypothetical protein [Clostridia bacterium]